MSILSFSVFLFFSFKTGTVVYSSGTDDISAYDLTTFEEGGLEIVDEGSLFVFEKEYNINELDRMAEADNAVEQTEEESVAENDKKEIVVEFYTVERGDSLYKISKKIGQDINVLVANNPEVGNGVIKVGQKLKILSENGIYYKVKKGDTLSALAKRYKVKMSEIMEENNLENTSLVIGQKVFIKNPDLTFAKNDFNKTNTNNKIQNKTTVVQNKFAWPMKWNGVTSSFGGRYHPVLKRYIFHAGIDLRAGVGTPIYSPADGIITYSGWASGYGNLIKISHSNGYSTRYGHLDKMNVKQGDSVKIGQLIGYSGKTGRVTGPHLHYEIRQNEKPLNPMKFR